MNTFGKEFRNFALKFGKFTIWNKIAIYLELYNYSYSEFADKVINGIIAGGEIVPEKSDKYQLCVRYRGSEYYVWIENLWYAALCSVKKGETQTEGYANARPSRKTVVAFFNWLDAWIQKNMDGIISEELESRKYAIEDFIENDIL